MTASKGERREKRLAWIDQLERIDHDLRVAYWHRTIFTDLEQEIIAHSTPTTDGLFLFSYQRLYRDSTLLLVRRMAEQKHDRNLSLWRIWDAISRDPECVSRADYVAVRKRTLEERDADAYFTEHFGGGEHVAPERIDEFKNALNADAEKAKTYVNEHLAHLSKAPTMHSYPQWEISGLLDDVAANSNDLSGLLLQPHVMYREFYVPPTWKAALRGLYAGSSTKR